MTKFLAIQAQAIRVYPMKNVQDFGICRVKELINSNAIGKESLLRLSVQVLITHSGVFTGIFVQGELSIGKVVDGTEPLLTVNYLAVVAACFQVDLCSDIDVGHGPIFQDSVYKVGFRRRRPHGTSLKLCIEDKRTFIHPGEQVGNRILL
jgi:hypothetical protein